MNTQLMQVVEQVVRPLPSIKANKLRIRLELYTLLEQIYQEELSADDTSEVTALERAKQRFGDPELLREELLQTIPLSERAWAAADRLLVRRREGEGLVRFSLRIGLHAGIGMVLLGVVLYFVATYLKNDPPEFQFWEWWTLAIMTVGVNGFCLTLLGNAALAGFQLNDDRPQLVGRLQFILCTLAAGVLIAASQVLNMYYLVGPYWKHGYVEPFVYIGMITGTMFAVIVWLRAREDVHFLPWNQLPLSPKQTAKRGVA